MVFTLKAPTSQSNRAQSTRAHRGRSDPIPLHGARLADTRLPDKSSVISPVVVRGVVRVADFLLVTVARLVIAHMYINETGVLGNTRYITRRC